MVKPLWAPWRLEYIQQADELEGCVFCLEASSELAEPESLLVRRGASTIAVLNKFPTPPATCSSPRSATSVSLRR